MSFFASPRYYSAAEPNFSGLFRLIDDWDRHVQQTGGSGGAAGAQRAGRHHLQLISPKFDLKETEAAYELHGELPGIEKDRVHIEFSDDQTIVVRGSIERSYTSPSSGEPGEQSAAAAAAASAGASVPVNTERGDSHHKPHKVTVEDDTAATAPAGQEGGKAVEKTKPAGPVAAEAPPKHKYWVSERSFGEFSRSFAFPGRIDTEAVTASLKDGVLTVVAPKAKKHESRRIAIN